MTGLSLHAEQLRPSAAAAVHRSQNVTSSDRKNKNNQLKEAKLLSRAEREPGDWNVLCEHP